MVAQILRVLCSVQGIFRRFTDVCWMGEEGFVPALGNSYVRSIHRSILPSPWVNRIEELPMCFSNMLVINGGPSSQGTNGLKDLGFKGCCFQMTNNFKVFFFERISKISFCLVIPERIKDLKLHLAEIVNLK